MWRRWCARRSCGAASTCVAAPSCMRAEISAGGKEIMFDHAGKRERVQAAEILVALGRRPALAGLGLGEAGVELNGVGNVVTAATQQTTNPRVLWRETPAVRWRWCIWRSSRARLPRKMQRPSLRGDPLASGNGLSLPALWRFHGAAGGGRRSDGGGSIRARRFLCGRAASVRRSRQVDRHGRDGRICEAARRIREPGRFLEPGSWGRRRRS